MPRRANSLPSVAPGMGTGMPSGSLSFKTHHSMSRTTRNRAVEGPSRGSIPQSQKQGDRSLLIRTSTAPARGWARFGRRPYRCGSDGISEQWAECTALGAHQSQRRGRESGIEQSRYSGTGRQRDMSADGLEHYSGLGRYVGRKLPAVGTGPSLSLGCVVWPAMRGRRCPGRSPEDGRLASRWP